MAEIARELRMNASTCFNILKTMQSLNLLGYDPDTKRYELGLALVEFSALVKGENQILRLTLERLRSFTKATGLTCFVAQLSAEDEFVIVGKSEGTQRHRLTVATGARFEPSAAVLAKAYYAWTAESTFDSMIERYGLHARSPYSITDVARFKKEVASVRSRGYSTSVGEYFPEYNEVGAAVIDASGHVGYVLVVSGLASQISPRALPLIGQRLSVTADAITQEIGGKVPRDWKNLTGWREV